MSSACFLLLMSLAGAMLWAGICAAFAVPQHLRFKRGCAGYTGKEARRTVIGFVISGAIMQAGFWLLAVSAMQAVGYNRHREANVNARTVYENAVDYQKKHPSVPLQTVVVETTGVYPEDSLEASLKSLFAYEREDSCCVLIVGTDGMPEAAYWSYNPLHKDSLHGTTRKQAENIVLNPLIDDNCIVGEYIPQK